MIARLSSKLSQLPLVKNSHGKASVLESTMSVQWLMIVVVFFNQLTLFQELETWLIALSLLCVAWKIRLCSSNKRYASKIALILVALAGCVVLALRANSLGLLVSMIHLLCFAYSLKMLEQRSDRDFFQLIVIGLFILGSGLIFTQSLGFFAIFIALLSANIALLLKFVSNKVSFSLAQKRSLVMLLQSIPLAVALFFLFPKLAPLWKMPLSQSATTGLSDEVKVGDIANLALSNEVAFRVEFDDASLTHSQLYWRTLVLDRFDGTKWFQKAPPIKYLEKFSRFKPAVSGVAIDYQVFAEPSYQHWLFSLDVPLIKGTGSSQISMLQKSDYTLIAKLPITQTTTYQLTSYPNASLDYPSANQVALSNRNLRLPESSNPRLQAEGKALREQFADQPQWQQKVVSHVLSRFRQQNYFYTLQPPLLSGNTLDAFYFDQMAGFCEHYASSFAFLMRSAGIPARVVVGYMGGEYNQQGNFYTIRQRDAHAWTEVYYPDTGWVRVDPTAAVSPDRIEQGFSDELFQQQSSLSGDFIDFNQLGNIQWLNALKIELENLDYQWTRWVVGYDADKQVDLLREWFGNGAKWLSTLAIIFTFMMTILAVFWAQQWRKNAKPKPIWQGYYDKLLVAMNKKNISKTPQQTILDFARQVSDTHNELGLAFTEFSQTINCLAYQHLTDKQRNYLQGVIKRQYLACKVALKSC